MRFRKLHLSVETRDGAFEANQDFPDGLVVVWADNSMGKSTCVKSILVALGLEAMLTTSRSELPLPPAVLDQLDSDDGEHRVLQSEVLLEIENNSGKRIVIQRTLKGERDKNLVTVHNGPVLTEPAENYTSEDFFVNLQGAAQRERGFHRYLADFLNWDLPTVQTFDGNDYPLYLQCVFPYFVVEQTRGWTSVQPPLPTQFRIRDAHKRAIEFILNLDAHVVARKRQELLLEKSRIEGDWSGQILSIKELAERTSTNPQGFPKAPVVAWPPKIAPSVMVPTGEDWTTLEKRIETQKNDLKELVESEIPRVEEVKASAQIELTEAEEKVREQQSFLSRLLDALQAEEQEVSRIRMRLKALDEDIRRNKDNRTLRKLGSRENSSVDSGSCPVCHQSIQDSLVPLDVEQSVMSLDENIDFLQEQKQTYEVVLRNAVQVVRARQNQVSGLRIELSDRRDSVRTLRQTLVSDGRQPSVAAIEARVRLEHSIARNQEIRDQFFQATLKFESLASQWKNNTEAIGRLPKRDVTEEDKSRLEQFGEIFREQLSAYGFRSFKPSQIRISPDTYKPEHAGFDLENSFSASEELKRVSSSLQTSISASDLIRTIWSYLHGLLEMSRVAKINHPGTIIFDEPRQQSTRDVSFSALLKRASKAAEFNQQVIFFTSEDRSRLKEQAKGLPHSFFEIEGRVLKRSE